MQKVQVKERDSQEEQGGGGGDSGGSSSNSSSELHLHTSMGSSHFFYVNVWEHFYLWLILCMKLFQICVIITEFFLHPELFKCQIPWCVQDQA